METDRTVVRRFRYSASAAIFGTHGIAFAVLAWWSWRKWPDPLIDFGRELYVPWQITQGHVLYRDVASLFGPLSPYLNALWFRLFGVSMMTLVWCNLVIFGATIAGIYWLVRQSTDRLTASFASLVVMTLFGFSQYLSVGNYNFICPYSHEATHGLALSVGLMVCLNRAASTARRVLYVMAGTCLGAVLLTKPELAMAALAAVLAGLWASHALDVHEGHTVRRALPMLLGGAAVPPILFFLYFTQHMPPLMALRATLGAWVPLFAHGMVTNGYYLHSMGFDHPLANTVAMLWSFGGFLLFVVVAIAVCSMRGHDSSIKRGIGFAVIAGLLVLATPETVPRILPLLTAVGFLASLVNFGRARNDRLHALRAVPLVMWSSFALVLLAKMALDSRFVHYGFYLALPAVVMAVVTLFFVVPQWLAEWRSADSARVFRYVVYAATVWTVIPYIAASNVWFRSKTLPIGTGGDRFYASTHPQLWQGDVVRQILQEVEAAGAPDQTMAVLPEGVMLNYLLRRESPLRVVNVMPPEILTFGEAEILTSLQAAPPDFVVVIQKDTSEYGYPLFGTDSRYGLRTMAWVGAHYRLIRTIGRDVMSDAGFGAEIFKRAP